MAKIVSEATWRKWRVILYRKVDVDIPVLIDPKGHNWWALPDDAVGKLLRYFYKGNKKDLIEGIKIGKKYLEDHGYFTKETKASVVDEEILYYLSRPWRIHKLYSPKEIAVGINRDPVYVWDRLQILVKKGKVRKLGRGKYTIVKR